MEEDRYRYRERSHRSHHSETQRGKCLGFLGFQLIVCSICLAVALILRFVGGGVYTSVRGGVTKALTGTAGKDTLTQAFDTIRSGLNNAKSTFTSQAASESSAKSQPSASGSKANSAAQKADQKTTQNSTASSAAAGLKAAALAPVAAGGEDLPATYGSEGTLQPPKTANLGPYLLSARPVWPVTGDITSGFGYRINPITNKLSFHTGIDIASPEGTPIGAALPGVVSQTGVSDAYGNYLILSHGGGVETFYGHCEKILVAKGQHLRIGETVALVGTTGMSTGYHLHFEIRVNQINVNPTWVLTQRE